MSNTNEKTETVEERLELMEELLSIIKPSIMRKIQNGAEPNGETVIAVIREFQAFMS